jgi:putative ABC transport system substrate-binding protein
MTTRRKFLLTLPALYATSFSRAQGPERAGKVVRAGILVTSTAAKYQTLEKIFIETLRDSGWTEGNNIVFDRAYADDDESRLPLLSEGLVTRNANLIFAPYNAPLLAAFAKTRTIPIVFSAVTGPVEIGLARSLAHPGGNVTGVANISWELGGKRMQLLKQAIPKLSRIGVLVNPTIDYSLREQQLIEQAAASSRARIVPVMAKEVGDIEGAFASLSRNRVEAVIVTHNALFIISGRKHVLAFAARYRIPVIGPRGELTEEGALMSYGSNLDDQTRRAAQLADKILRGTKPADIPIEQPTKFELVINKITAKTLGITFPGEIMLQATRVIE